MKSVSRVVKCFSMSDPLAPCVDLGCPSLQGPSKIHKWNKIVTIHFHEKIFSLFLNLKMYRCPKFDDDAKQTLEIRVKQNENNHRVLYLIKIQAEYLL